MASKGILDKLYKLAAALRFDDFYVAYPCSGEAVAETEDEAALIRTQIGLFASDPSALADIGGLTIKTAEKPCLAGVWPPDSPNRFAVFDRSDGALAGFLDALPRFALLLEKFYGSEGRAMADQVQSEILYYSGRIEEALAVAENKYKTMAKSPVDVMLAQYVMFRCYLASGAVEMAQLCMLEMIRSSKTHPECIRQYSVIRSWANMTTGWSGDSPRFIEKADTEIPVLKDRIKEISEGIALLSPAEDAFSRESRRVCGDNACTMRGYYMDIFNALHWFSSGDNDRTRADFDKAYAISAATGLVMPFAEYGAQILPLLAHMKKAGNYASDWLDRVSNLAEGYEKSIVSYRN